MDGFDICAQEKRHHGLVVDATANAEPGVDILFFGRGWAWDGEAEWIYDDASA